MSKRAAASSPLTAMPPSRPLQEYFCQLDIPPVDLIQLAPASGHFQDKNHEELYASIIQCLRQGKADEARKVANYIAAQYPRDHESLNIEACFLIRAGDFSAAEKCLIRASRIAKADSKILNNLGITAYRQFKYTQAISYFQQALKHASTLPQVHFNLGLVYEAQNDTRNAYAAYEQSIKCGPTREAVCRFGNLLRLGGKVEEAGKVLESAYTKYPDYAPAAFYLAAVLGITGDAERQHNLSMQALLLEPNNRHYQVLFAQKFDGKSFETYSPEAESAVMAALAANVSTLGAMWLPWVSLLAKNPANANIMTLMSITDYETFRDHLLSCNRYNLYTPFFLAGLRYILSMNPNMERMLRYWRRILLIDNMNGLLEFSSGDQAFLAALATQCFFNEYAWDIDAEEHEFCEKLEAQTPYTENSLLLLACYKPLYTLPDAATIYATYQNTNSPLLDVLKTQIAEPLEEQRLRQSLHSFSPVADDISRKVQDQYEEHPYPRWTSLPLLERYDARPSTVRAKQRTRALIAGCGTGQQILSHARLFQDFHFTAIDLSRASLAYAQRKCAEYGLDAITFHHGDILDVEKLGQSFDHIFCTGVLHHMRDPDAGLAALYRVLRPGGTMQLAVYSEIARRFLVAGQRHVREKGFASTTEDIRRFRAEVMLLPDDHPMERLRRVVDFYITSNCRDLLFHVQEHNFTVQTLHDWLTRHNLRFKWFLFTDDSLKKFKSDFPDRDPYQLLNWADFEEKYPDTFYGMYQFLVEKPLE